MNLGQLTRERTVVKGSNNNDSCIVVDSYDDNDDTYAQQLAYTNVCVRRNGRVLQRAQVEELRIRDGYCPTCVGIPIKLYDVRKCRYNPLRKTKEPISILDKSRDGRCLVCHPEQHYSRHYTSSKQNKIRRHHNSNDEQNVVEPDKVISFHKSIAKMSKNQKSTDYQSRRDSGNTIYSGTTATTHLSETSSHLPNNIIERYEQRDRIYEDPSSSPSEVVRNLETTISDMMSSSSNNSNIDLLIDFLISQMTYYEMDESIQDLCIRKLSELASNNSRAKDLIVSSSFPSTSNNGSAVDVILTTMKNHLSSPDIQQQACKLLESLSSEGAQVHRRRILVKSGIATDRLIKTAKLYSKHETIVCHAFGALCNLSPVQEFLETISSSYNNNANNDWKDIVLNVMELHLPVRKIQRDGIIILLNTSFDGKTKKEQVVLPTSTSVVQELKCIVNAMKKHSSDHSQRMSVMSVGCFALKNYIYDRKNLECLQQQKQFRNVLPSLLSHTVEYTKHDNCRRDAQIILDRLGLLDSITVNDDNKNNNVKGSNASFVPRQTESLIKESNGATGGQQRSVAPNYDNVDKAPRAVADLRFEDPTTTSVEDILYKLNRHGSSSESISCKQLKALSTKARNGSSVDRDQIVAPSSLNCILHIMILHKQSSSVQQRGFELLDYLTRLNINGCDDGCNNKKRSLLIDIGLSVVVRTISKRRKQHKNHNSSKDASSSFAAVRYAAFQLLEILSCDFECWFNLVQRGYMDDVEEAIAIAQVNQSLHINMDKEISTILSNFEKHSSQLS